MKKNLPVYSICALRESRAASEDFITAELGHYLKVHTDLKFPHKHDFYHLVYFSSGSGTHSIDFISYDVEPGQIYFMIPGQVHTWEFDETPTGYIVNFSAEFIHQLIVDPRYLDQFNFFSGNAKEQVIDLSKTTYKECEALLKNMLDEFREEKVLSNDMIRSQLLQLFILVSRTVNSENDNSKQNCNSLIIRNFLKLIEQHFRQKRLTKDYAAMLFVTPNHLNALAKNFSGRSAGDLIRERVLLEVKRMLVNLDFNISEIANHLQFPDNSYFSRFFKKYVGVNPETFRSQTIKK